MSWTRLVEFTPAYDHGRQGRIHGVELRFVLKGPEGAVQFLVFTNWMLPETRERLDAQLLAKGIDETTLRCLFHPMAADLGYHSPKPMYEGHEPMRYVYRMPRFTTTLEDFVPGVYGDPVICPYLEGDVPCYYDGSGLNAEPVMERLLREGDEGVWSALEEYYERTFR